MNRKLSLFLIVIVSVLPGLLLAQAYVANVSKVGTTAATFLEIGVGARAIAMGGAFVAVANDVSAIYWNPAGLSRIRNNGIVLSHTQWLADIQFNFAGLSINLGQYGTVGTSFTALTMDEMQVRTVAEPEGTGEYFQCGDFALGISYAYNITDRFSIGFNGKYIRQNIWHMNASSMAVDVGVLFYTPFPNITLGMSISNFGSKMQLTGKNTLYLHDIDPEHLGNNARINAYLETGKWSLPLIFRFGLSWRPLHTEMNSLLFAVDALHPNDNYESINVGGEYVFRQRVALRMGYKSLFLSDSEENLTFGVGFIQRFVGNIGFRLDYAYADFGRLEQTQKLSLEINF